MTKYYEMHVYTMGTRRYAHEILKIIDPEKKFFDKRVVTRDESVSNHTKTTNLDYLFPDGTKMVAVIDDNPGVWQHSDNLVATTPCVQCLYLATWSQQHRACNA